MGGKLQNRLLLNGNPDRRASIYSVVRPDVIHESQKQTGESKAICSGQSINLTDAQMNRYKLLQSVQEDTQIYFAIYRHSFPKIKSYKGNDEELFASLAKVTHLSIVLPFSVVIQLHDSTNNELVYRYNGDRFSWCTCIRSPTLNRFLTEPERVVEELELNGEDFVFRRFMSPESFSIGGNYVPSFPIVRILDRDHEKWRKGFSFDIEKEDPELKEEYDYLLFGNIDPETYDPRADGCYEDIEENGDYYDEEDIPF